MGDTGLVEFRGHDPHLLRQFLRDADTGFEAGRIDAVVVGDEDAQADYFPSS
jgi:hypothetical protein